MTTRSDREMARLAQGFDEERPVEIHAERPHDIPVTSNKAYRSAGTCEEQKSAPLSKAHLVEKLRQQPDTVLSPRVQRALKLQHVDSLTLPSLNGASSKSFEQGHLAQPQFGSAVRATPRRAVKEGVSYAVLQVSPREDGSESEESEWSELAESEQEVESEVEEIQPRALWPSTKKAGSGDRARLPLEVIDLTSPRKPRGAHVRDVSQEPGLSSRRLSCSSDDENTAVLRL